MPQIKTTQDIKKLGTILSIWAHPDDESFCAGGLLAAAVQNGQKVVCITATKGEAGVKDESRWPAARLAEIRTKEMAQALKCLGCTEHHWLGYADGGCASVASVEAERKIQTLIEKYQPNTIITFGPDGLTGHPDHQTVSKWVLAVVEASHRQINVFQVVQTPETYEDMKVADEQFNIYFNTSKPPLVNAQDCAIVLELPEELLDKKYQALKAQPSQTEDLLSRFSEEFIRKMFRTEAFVQA